MSDEALVNRHQRVPKRDSDDCNRLAYNSPEFKFYGNVGQLTASGSEAGKEGPGLGNQNKMP